MLVYGAGAAWSCFFCLEPELEPPKKVAAPQHWTVVTVATGTV